MRRGGKRRTETESKSRRKEDGKVERERSERKAKTREE